MSEATLLAQPLSLLKGVGARTANLLAGLHLHTVQDLLFHLPYRYEDRTRIYPLAHLQVGQRVLVEAAVEKTWVQMAKRRMLLCRVSDGARLLTLRFFHFRATQQKQLVVGCRLRCFGEVRMGQYGLEMIHPQYQVLPPDEILPLENSLTPVYPVTEGLGQATLRKLVAQALHCLQQGTVAEWLPQESLCSGNFMALKEALQILHQPTAEQGQQALFEAARQRLALEELLVYQWKLRGSRQKLRQQAAVPLNDSAVLMAEFLSRLPFQLTGAQQRVWQVVQADLAKGSPMLRLVQGDVGSGKTMLALMALLQAVASGQQAALMVPTEILAEQHWGQCQRYLQPLGVRVARLVGSLKAKERRDVLAAMAAHDVDIVVGTHALFQEKVGFAKLALVVVDEQHRFGVQQRLALQQKGREGCVPHQLVMTATPIPRTLAMTAYADLDYSVIDELPPGRKPIQTLLQGQSAKDALMARLQSYCEAGHQAYWVCTLIEESESLQAEAAEQAAENLKQALPPYIKVGLLHGRMAPDDKQKVMDAFSAGELQVLVATTVIEVGVDVPNASLMVIENPERLGLAQLHQLRGRVGRGQVQSYCVLLYRQGLSSQAKSRLQIMRDYQDGFQIADADLKLRGAGEMMGKRQSGAMLFRVADLQKDEAMVELAQQLLGQMQGDVVQALARRWQSVYHESTLGV